MFYQSTRSRPFAYRLDVSTLILILVVCGITCITSAQEPNSSDLEPNTGRVSVELGLDITSAYYFRGILQENNGAIVQPWTEIGFAIADGDDQSPSINAHLGTWNSLHSAHTGSTGNGKDAWYESDLYGGVSFGWDAIELGVSYTIYTYPNSDFNTVQELGITLGIDLPDETLGAWLGDVTLGLHFEVDNSNVGADKATYFQLDLGPSFDIFEGNATLSIPVSLGLSVDDYYVGTDDETFGFLSIGAAMELPLSSGEFGDITLNTGVTVLVLGDTTEAANNGDGSEVLAYAGVSLSF